MESPFYPGDLVKLSLVVGAGERERIRRGGGEQEEGEKEGEEKEKKWGGEGKGRRSIFKKKLYFEIILDSQGYARLLTRAWAPAFISGDILNKCSTMSY